MNSEREVFGADETAEECDEADSSLFFFWIDQTTCRTFKQVRLSFFLSMHYFFSATCPDVKCCLFLETACRQLPYVSATMSMVSCCR